ncbi:MAG TPA: hypothetical protein VGQ79_06770 [Nitrospiraceae bacterium]|nr:hypothetical protein [Nitrospiraceae bacterium]
MASPRQFAGHPWSLCAYEPKRRLGDTEVDFTQTLPCLQEESFLPQHTNRFSEADLLTRTPLTMVADLFNVGVVDHFRSQRSEIYALRRSANHP